MKKSVKSNMYEYTLDETWELFADYVNGQHAVSACIISSDPLQEVSVSALQNSFLRLGYGKSACTFITLQGNNLPVLTEQELFSLVEGFDPLVLVITDAAAAETLSSSYRQDIPLDKRSRLFGREVRAFVSFETLLAEPVTKQKAWALLKTLPKLDS